ncbi:ABC transporter ATP-binding protein [Halosquirtibacter xylanolyticus]|uniref:ATP-binding cassette domain-containing protein n=1 Tax=Halosquirtibacter xylanolyticus TaxID=3374599 RepID=UPI003747F103|nr:ABC transporter ATP-binding protein [Prolixibacteraceae bacterium]
MDILGHNISLSFGDKLVLDRFSFHVPSSARAVLKAPSGKGKSSLLRIIAGLQLMDEGDLYFNGELSLHANRKVLQKSMLWVPQNCIMPLERGIDLVTLMGYDRNIDTIHRYLDYLGLNSSILSLHLSELSGGEKQRLLLSISLSEYKPLLLLDEPTTGLDMESAQRLISLVDSLDQSTVISTSHDPVWIESCSQTIML